MRKKSRSASVFSCVFLVYSILLTTCLAAAGIFFAVNYGDLDDPALVKVPSTYASRLYDGRGNLVKAIGSDEGHVSYDELPAVLLDAVVAVEDNSYYQHDGVDIHRVFGSVFHNLTSDSSLQGASTLTQQLARNLFLSSEQTLERKVKELLLSFKLEAAYDKKTILEFYFNTVHFDPVFPGIARASTKYFNKDVKDLTLTEAATLVGLVKSPSAYEPFKHPAAADKRKNIVLKKMSDCSFITVGEYRHSAKIAVEDLLYHQSKNEVALPYQAYLDVVYEECRRLIGEDPYSAPLDIYTYLEPQLQKSVDSIQRGELVGFEDELQQFGLALIDSHTGHVAAVGGGRNYTGARLFNRAYDKKVGPASTIKPIFNYLLAVEKLGYNKATTLIDEETRYLSGEKLENAGGHYSGRLALIDALGYSKNTTAIQTLNRLTEMYGEEYLVSHLDRLGLMDEGPYTESYGLGGMREGVSLIDLAAAYSIFASGGEYRAPKLIDKIVSRGGKVLYQNVDVPEQIVSSETSYVMADMLQELVEEDYNSLGKVRIPGVKIGAKTGTGEYDKSVTARYSYPRGVDRDSFVVGFSPDYSLAVWTGFDVPLQGEKAYFSAGDSRKQLTKKIFKTVMGSAAKTDLTLRQPDGVFETTVVRGADSLYYPNELIPSAYTMRTLLAEPQALTVYPLPVLSKPEGTLFEFDERLSLNLSSLPVADTVYQKIYGPLGYFISIDGVEYFTEKSVSEIVKSAPIGRIEVRLGYSDLDSQKSEPLVFNLDSLLDHIF